MTARFPYIAELKLIALDLDGTVTCPEGVNPISSRTFKAVREVQEMKLPVTFITGRAEEYALAVANKFRISVPIITYNGARIFSTIQRRTIEETYIESRLLPKLLAWLDSAKVTIAAYWQSANGLRLAQNRSSGSRTTDDYLFGSPREIVGSLLDDHSKHQEESLAKVILATREPIEEKLKSSFKDKIQAVRTHADLVEILPAGVSKGSGLRKLCALLGIEPESVLAIGDQENDISTFQTAGYSVAMGNAPLSVKKSAKWVTGSFIEDGVAQVLEKLTTQERNLTK